MTDDRKRLLEDYEHFYNNVAQCYTYLVANNGSDNQKIRDLIALTAGQALGLAARLHIAFKAPKEYREATITTTKPWEEIGISRSTYYRDQRRSKLNDAHIQQHDDD